LPDIPPLHRYQFTTRASHSDLHKCLRLTKSTQRVDDGPHEIAYRDTEHFTLTRRFLNPTEEMLEVLLNRDLYGD
jgi:hypothetical protein